MTPVGYLEAGWGISLVELGGYAFGLVRRGRRLAPRVPVDGRRWIDSSGSDRG